VSDNSGAAFEAAIRRVAAVTDYRAFVDALGWLPADIELLDEAYAMFTFGLTTEDVVAVLKSDYAFAYVQGFRQLMDAPDADSGRNQDAAEGGPRMTILAAMVEDAPAKAELPVCCKACGRVIGRYAPPVGFGSWWCHRCHVATALEDIAA
jgi:hypothetical protein